MVIDILLFCRLMKTLLEDLQNLTKDDHLLLRLLVYLSSEYDIDIILDHAPVHIVAVHLSILCQKYERFSRKKVCFK